MSADKRRRARVQGGWAAPTPKIRMQPVQTQRPAANTVGIACLGKTIDVPNSEKFTFKEPEEVLAYWIDKRHLSLVRVWKCDKTIV